MRITPLLRAAEPLTGHLVRVRYADGVRGDVDLAYLVGRGPVFEPLADLTFFRRLRVHRQANTIVWPNGADIAPETLYAAAGGVTKTQKSRSASRAKRRPRAGSRTATPVTNRAKR